MIEQNIQRSLSLSQNLASLTYGCFVQVSTAALKLFAFGQKEAEQRGLLLVDTKYEFGKTPDGSILLIDEVHTPDSSRSDSMSILNTAGLKHRDQTCRRDLSLTKMPHASFAQYGPLKLASIQAQLQRHASEILNCRYWISNTYQDRHKVGQEPENIDKEFIRLWFREHCDPYKDKV